MQIPIKLVGEEEEKVGNRLLHYEQGVIKRS